MWPKTPEVTTNKADILKWRMTPEKWVEDRVAFHSTRSMRTWIGGCGMHSHGVLLGLLKKGKSLLPIVEQSWGRIFKKAFLLNEEVFYVTLTSTCPVSRLSAPLRQAACNLLADRLMFWRGSDPAFLFHTTTNAFLNNWITLKVISSGTTSLNQYNTILFKLK